MATQIDTAIWNIEAPAEFPVKDATAEIPNMASANNTAGPQLPFNAARAAFL
jgi:hypothetical protein